MKTLIVYYTMSGNTGYVARKVAEKSGAELLRLEPEKAYPDKGAKKFLWGGKSAVMKEKPALKPYEFHAENCDLIVFGTPVWASTFTPPIRTFVEENRAALAGKRFAVFTCFAGGGADKAIEKLRIFLEAGRFEAELILVDPKDRPTKENEERIDAFCEALNA